MNKNTILIIGLIAFLGACAHTPPKVTEQETTMRFKAQVTDNAPALKGSIVIQPFKSGEGVPADSEMNQASLMLVKGFTETVNQAQSDLQVITDDRLNAAHFFLKGYITKYEQPKGMINHWRKRPNVFGVEGKIIDLNSDRIVVSFSASVESSEDSDYRDLAYKVGSRIATYAVGQDKESP